MTEQRNPIYYKISTIKTHGLRPARFAQEAAEREVRVRRHQGSPLSRTERVCTGRERAEAHGHFRVRTVDRMMSLLVSSKHSFTPADCVSVISILIALSKVEILIAPPQLVHFHNHHFLFPSIFLSKFFFYVAINCFLTLTSVHLHTPSSRKSLAPNL